MAVRWRGGRRHQHHTAKRSPFPAVSTGSGTIRTAFADMCLYVPGSANGTKAGVWKCDGTSSQRWTAYNDGTLRINGKCLEVACGSTKAGAKVDIGTCNAGPNQQWQIGQVSYNHFGPITIRDPGLPSPTPAAAPRTAPSW